jgi:5-methylthioadenosine/S-adenosylhomocysteine deaminase
MAQLFDLGLRAKWGLPMTAGGPVIENIFLAVKGDKIAEVSPYQSRAKKYCKKFVDFPRHIVLPGLVNCHTHLAMTLFRGLEDDVSLKTWLFERIFPLESQFVSPDFVRTGTELAALECLRFGTTTVNEMYFFPDEAARVWERMGLRGRFSQAFIDFPIPEDKWFKVDRATRLRKLAKKYEHHGRISIGLGPHSPYTCSAALLGEVRDLAAELELPIHIHVSETSAELNESIEKHKQTPVERLHKLGLLKQGTICAHMVHLKEPDFSLLSQSGAAVAYNPDSNMKLASGMAPISRFLKENIPVGLGTDGSASKNDLSLFSSMNIGTKLQKVMAGDNLAMTAKQALHMATLGGAHALGLGTEIGSLEVGKQADFILVDTHFAHMQPVHDPYSLLVYAANGLEVDSVYCAGKSLMRNKKFTQVSAGQFKNLLKKTETYRRKIHQALSHTQHQGVTHAQTEFA